jgi:hypothetical protein
VRLGGYILVEAALAATLATAVGVAGFEGLTRARAWWRGQAAAAATVAAADSRDVDPGRPGQLRAHAELSSLPDLRVALESAGTFLGMSDELLLARVRTQPIARFKVNHGGSSLSFRVEFADGSRAAWKPAQTNLQTIPRKEIAAYRLNRLLGLNAVPPAAPRAVTRDELLAHLHPDSLPAIPRIRAETIFDPSGRTMGAASYWIPVIRDSGFDVAPARQQAEAWLAQGEAIPMEQRAMAAQLSDLAVFDFLTANTDRYSGGNMKMSSDGGQLFFMDNTLSFFLELDGKDRNRQALFKTQRFSRALYGALDRIDAPTLDRILGEDSGSPLEILTAAEIRAVVTRRDLARRYIDDLIAQYGRKSVLFFP